MTNTAKQQLEKYGIRPSVQRMAVMEYLLIHRTHPPVEEIYNALSPGIPTLSKTTVYNTLNLFAEQGAIQILDLDSRQARYDGDNSTHAHFICSQCGRVGDVFLSDEALKSLYGQSPTAQGSVRSIQLTYKGLCAECTIEK